MAVVAVSVESNGWVLAVRGTWGATVGAWTFVDRNDGEWRTAGVNQFPLDPGGTPRITLNVRDAGHDRIGGLPVASSNRPRTVVATKPLRRPFPNQAQLDETDNGDGTRTIRLALSDRVYSTSSIVSAAFGAGWRVGEGSAVINTVTNSSTRAAPVPIFRWANEPWPYVGGTVGAPVNTARVDVIIASHHPEHVANVDGSRHQACAALLLTAYDGTSSKQFWFSSPQTSTLYGDNLRCWGGSIDLSGLSAGPITVHATVFPWVGSPRATGTAHSTDRNAAMASAWGGPFHLWYDPDGTVWTRRYVAIDPASPNTDPFNSAQLAAVVTSHTTAAAAEAAAVGTKPGNYFMALCAMTARNQTFPARNGFTSFARCLAWFEILCPVGTTTHTSAVGSSQTSSIGGGEVGPGYLIISAVPSASTPRTNVIFGASGSTFGNGRANRVKMRGLRVNLGAVAPFSNNSVANTWESYENCDISSGAAAGGNTLFNAAVFTSTVNCEMRDRTSHPRGWLSRNVVRTSGMPSSQTAVVINTSIVVPGAGETRLPARNLSAFSAGSTNVDDLMIWGCRVHTWQNGFATANGATNFGDNIASFRWAIVNTVYELATDAGGKIFAAFGETGGSALRDSIFENVTVVGGRFNWHNDAPYAATTGTLAAVRVNNSPTTTITIGLAAHGLATGDTVTIAGFANSNLNRTAVAVTVLDVNRFQYTAAAAVTTVTSNGLRSDMTAAGDTQGGPRVTFTSGPNNGQTRFIIGHNNVHTGNVIRYSAFDRNATKHDTFNNDGGLIESWELLHGVGYRGNTNANRGTASPSNFQYAFYGVGSEMEFNFTGPTTSPVASYGVNWFGYLDDLSANGPGEPAGVGSGDYRAHNILSAPFKPSRLLNKGDRPAVIDRDANNSVRANTFDGGALGRLPNSVLPSVLQPSGAAHAHRAAQGIIRWRVSIATADAGSGMSAGQGGVALVVTPVASLNRQLGVLPDGRDLHVDPE